MVHSLNNENVLTISERYINKLESFFISNCNNGDAFLKVNSIVMKTQNSRTQLSCIVKATTHHHYWQLIKTKTIYSL